MSLYTFTAGALEAAGWLQLLLGIVLILVLAAQYQCVELSRFSTCDNTTARIVIVAGGLAGHSSRLSCASG